ncbi:MAG: thioesterase family protein [Gordonia sp. (in: high G+C Gram-positive bacteria)]|uniref:thioesterase family protein n=1 Tax=Gordonia sp. (in: high G+C Gram-positive bacteria) TaxID=84139 RepID=UPI0039E24D2B
MDGVTQSYFTRDGDDAFVPTEHAGGAWYDNDLHLAPVAGLVIDHLERWRLANAPGMVFSRLSLDVLGMILRDRITLSVDVLRPGRTIELVQATAVIDGRSVILARGWLLQSSDTTEAAGDAVEPFPPPGSFTRESWIKRWPGELIDSVDATQSDDTRPGRAKVWVTSDVDLVAGEESTALGEWAKFLDCANGISWRQDPNVWMFPNVDLTLHLFRQPAGRWMGLDTRQDFGAGGLGLTSSVVHDEHGPVGVLAQSLTVRKQPD